MAVNNYLEKFRSGLRKAQSEQVLAILNKERQRGSITSVQEFRDRLEELTKNLQAQTLTPMLEVYVAEIGEIIDSESFNFMIDRIEDDLSAGFAEAEDISEILDLHEQIVNNVVFRNLQVALDELEGRISTYEFLAKSTHGFSDGFFNTFKGSQNNRTADDKTVLLIDPKSNSISSVDNPAKIDLVGEKLVLGAAIEELYTPTSARQIFDSEAIGSELDVEFRNNDINNIIDNTTGTFWLQSVLLSEAKGEAGVATKVEITLPGVREINYIQIEPVSFYPLEVSNITLIDENNQAQTVLTTSQEIRDTNKLFFRGIATKKLVVTFKNKHYSEVQFRTSPDSPIPTIVRDMSQFSDSLTNISDTLLEVVKNPVTIEAAGIESFSSESKRFFEYFVGIDNIRVGYSVFDETSVFVGKTQKVKAVSQVGLRVSEKRPVKTSGSVLPEYTSTTYPSSYDDQFLGSIEYYVIKRDFSEGAALLNTSVLPVLPLNASNIRHERLVLSEKTDPTSTKNNRGYLQFYSYESGATEESGSGIKVYENGIFLPNKDSSPSSATGWIKDTSASQSFPNQDGKMKFAIKILNARPSSVYTVSYTPATSTTNRVFPGANTTEFTSNTGLKVVDLTGRLRSWLGNNNLLYFKDNFIGTKIAYSEINLAIVLRRSTAQTNVSPVVEDYLLLVGSKDSNKFGEA